MRLQGTGGEGVWRRSLALLVQVSLSFGAGVEKRVAPAPPQCVKVRFTAQVPTEKPYLRQKSPTPAPMGNSLIDNKKSAAGKRRVYSEVVSGASGFVLTGLLISYVQ